MAEAVTLYRRGRGPLVLSCEHASARIPRPLRVGDADRRWLSTHWAVDLGAANVTREVARRTRSVALLARFSRLVCDPNRPPSAVDWIRAEVEGHTLELNSGLDDAELRRRWRVYHEGYHGAVGREVGRRVAAGRSVVLVAIHSFTPRMGGKRRQMEAGVLFDERFEGLGRRLARRLTRTGLRVALNRPYSGRRGMIHSVQRHGRAHGVPYLEIELRRDLVTPAPRARAMGRLVAEALLWLTGSMA